MRFIDLFYGIFNWYTLLINTVIVILLNSVPYFDENIKKFVITLIGFILIFEGYKRQKYLRESGLVGIRQNNWFGDLLL